MSVKKEKKSIVLDVDGVLLDFMSAYDVAAEKILNRKITPNKDEDENNYYCLAKRVGIDVELVPQILQYMVDVGMYRNLDAIPGAKEAVKAIADAGYDIYVITAVPDNVKEDRLRNLKEKLNFTPKEIYCVGMGLGKKEALLGVNPDIFIDDRIQYLASVPDLYHLVLIDQLESQDDNAFQVDVISPSIKVWVDKYLKDITHKLDLHYEKGMPLQKNIPLESMEIRLDRRKKMRI